MPTMICNCGFAIPLGAVPCPYAYYLVPEGEYWTVAESDSLDVSDIPKKCGKLWTCPECCGVILRLSADGDYQFFRRIP